MRLPKMHWMLWIPVVFLILWFAASKMGVLEQIVIPPDELAPQLNVSDQTLDFQQQWDPLEGVTATDETDGDLIQKVQWQGEVFTDQPDDYEILFWVEDAAGNRTEKTSIVTVINPFINDMPGYEVFVTPTEANIQIYQMVKEHFKDDWDKVGFYYENLTTGEVVAVRPNVQYLTASTGKMMVLMPLMDRVSKGTADLDEMIPYLPQDFTYGTGAIKYFDLTKPGLAFSLRTLAQYASVNSDNIAFRMLWRYLGTEEVYSFYEDVIGHETNRVDLETSAADAAKIMKLLYYSEGDHYDVLRYNLKNSLYPILIAELLPAGITAHKVGFYEGNIHDTAIVYGPNGDYLLSIYTDMLLEGYESIPEISLKIYNFKNPTQ